MACGVSPNHRLWNKYPSARRGSDAAGHGPALLNLIGHGDFHVLRWETSSAIASLIPQLTRRYARARGRVRAHLEVGDQIEAPGVDRERIVSYLLLGRLR